jgi:hypothetical protein
LRLSREIRLIGKPVAEVATRCRAEPGDLCAAARMAWSGVAIGRLFSACRAVA